MENKLKGVVKKRERTANILIFGVYVLVLIEIIKLLG
jgi:predicted nucleic acid-binding Zn ribbon protein